MFGFDDRTRALLAAIWRTGNIAAAAHALGLDASNARRHIRTAEERAGEKLIRTRRGGSDGRNTGITPAAKRMLHLTSHRGVAHEYDPRAGVTPIAVGRRILYAAGRHPAGPVEFHIAPESVALRRQHAAAAPKSSERNALAVRVEAIQPEREGTYRLNLTAGELRLDALVTQGAMRDLNIRSGSRLIAIIKAVAIDVSVLPRL